jgi:hypothetical protein
MEVDGATSCEAGIVTSIGIGSIALLGSVSILILFMNFEFVTRAKENADSGACIRCKFRPKRYTPVRFLYISHVILRDWTE